MKTVRLKLTYELVRSCGLFELTGSRLIETEAASVDDVLTVHDHRYVDVLQAVNNGKMMRGAHDYGLGPGDNPVFPGLWDWSLLSAGGSIMGADRKSVV